MPPSDTHRATSFQLALYQKALNKLNKWRGELRDGQLRVSALTRAAVSRWTLGLRLPSDVAGPAASLPDECALAASALAGLDEEGGNRFDSRRVIVLYAGSLTGTIPAGELAGDNVVVITPFLPSAAAATAAQAQLLVVGHGATDLVAPGPAAANRRVVVVIEEPSGDQF